MEETSIIAKRPRNSKKSLGAMPETVEETIELIRAHHRAARFALKQQMRIQQAMQSYVVFTELGADPNDKTGLQKKYTEAGKRIKIALDKADDPLHEMVVANARAVVPFLDVRESREYAMRKLAETLPLWKAWGENINGFGLLGFAQIVGECGDLSHYSTVSKLWKRLGLAVMDGKRQGAPGPKASAETWIAHGYNPKRRSIVWNIGQSLFKSQSGKIDEETGEVLKEVGHYRAIYDARKVYERPRVETDGHAHNRAVRYMEKMLIADLWSAWRRARRGIESNIELPDAEVSEQRKAA